MIILHDSRQFQIPEYPLHLWNFLYIEWTQFVLCSTLSAPWQQSTAACSIHSIQLLFIYSQEVLSINIKQAAVHGGLRVQTALRWTVWSDIKFGYFSPYSDSLRAWRSGDRFPVEARFSAPINTGRRAHPASSTMGTGSLSQRVKQLGRGVDQPYSSIAEVKEIVELYLSFPTGPSWPVLR